MKKTSISKFILLSVLLCIFCVCTLCLTEVCLKAKKNDQLLDQLSERQFIFLQNLTPNSTPYFRPERGEVPDSFHLDIKDYQSITDSSGFIVTARNTAHPDLKFVFLGGSAVQCLYAEDSERIPEAVTRLVERRSHLKINCWNSAAGGTNSYHTLNVLDNLVLDLKPDYAFFYGNINDIATLIHYGSYRNHNPRWAKVTTIDDFRGRRVPDSHALLPYTAAAIRSLLRKDTAGDDFADVRKQTIILDTGVILPPIRTVYRTMIATCKANNIKPVIITQVNCFKRLPYAWVVKNMPRFKIAQQDYTAFLQLLDEYNQVLIQIGHEQGAQVIILPDREATLGDFYDASHFNSMGAHKFSAIIAKLFIDQSGSPPAAQKINEP